MSLFKRKKNKKNNDPAANKPSEWPPPKKPVPEYDGLVYQVIGPNNPEPDGARMELNGWSRNQKTMSGLVLSLKLGEEVTFRRLQ